MRILQVGKFHFLQGGADKYFLDLSRALETRGHTVAHFSMRHPKNESSMWERYFVSRVDPNSRNPWQMLRALGRLFYSFEEKHLFGRLVRDFRPDIIHVHNVCYYLSLSFLIVARKYHIPVVVHLHDYSLLSPNYLLYTKAGNYAGGKQGRYHECIKDRCFKESLIYSVLGSMAMYSQQRIFRMYEQVRAYIAPSVCMKEQVAAWRPDIKNIEVIPHGTVIRPLGEERLNKTEERYFLYVGRLSSEKGVEVLMKAFAQAPDQGAKLKIVGDGPERARLEKLALTLGIHGRTEFLGFRGGVELQTLIEESVSVVAPSVWREVFGLTVIEAMERGRLVIASRIGGMQEIIVDRETGLLFDPGDDKALAENMRWVLEHPSLAQDIGKRARALVRERYEWENHVSRIETLYQTVIKK